MNRIAKQASFVTASALILALATFGVIHDHGSVMPPVGPQATPDCPVCALARTPSLVAVECVVHVFVPEPVLELEEIDRVLPDRLLAPAASTRGPPVSA